MPEPPPPRGPVRLRAQRRPFPDGRGPAHPPGRRRRRRPVRGDRPRTRDQRRCRRGHGRGRHRPPGVGSTPKRLDDGSVAASDVVITMGCGDTCPVCPGGRDEDWALDRPAGQGLEAVRPIRDEIRTRVERPMVSLGIPRHPNA